MARQRFVPVREPRHTVQRLADGVLVCVPPRRTWWKYLVAAWPALILAFGLGGMLVGDTGGESEAGFALVLVAWVGGLLIFIALGVWSLLAQEEIVVDGAALRCGRRFGPLGRIRAYDHSRVENLRVSPDSISPLDPRGGLRLYGLTGGTVAFDYGARTHRFADVEEAEAKLIVAELSPYLGGRA